MYLDTANIAAVQAKRIDAVVDSFVPKRNKMKFMKVLIDEGIMSFDSLEFFSSLSTI
jgi:hypothetical protein